MNTKFKITSVSIIAAVIPVVALAQQKSTLSTIVDQLVGLISDALFLLMAVAILVFVWQVIRYFVLPNEDRKNAGMYVMYAILGFFVIFSLWGLVNVLSNTFNLGSESKSWTQIQSSIFPHN